MNYSYTNADGRRSLVVVLDTGNAHTIPGSHPKFTELLHYLGNTADPDNQHVRRLIDFGADAADTLQRLSDRVTYRLGTIRFDGEIIDTALTRYIYVLARLICSWESGVAAGGFRQQALIFMFPTSLMKEVRHT